MKPWERYGQLEEEQQKKPWERYSSSEDSLETSPPASASTPSPSETPKPTYTPYATVQEEATQESLYTNEDWQRSSRVLYRLQNGKDIPTDWSAKDVAHWGMDEMSAFNWNLGSMAFDAKRIHGADQETKEAFLYAMEQFDELDNSWRTTGYALKNLALDPTTLAGMVTFGAAGASAQAAKVAGKEGLKAVLKESIKRTGASAVVAGAAEGIAENTLRQSVEISGGKKEDFSFTEAAVSGAVGGVLGGTLGVAADVAGSGIGKLKREASELFSGDKVKNTAKAPNVDAQGQVVAPDSGRVDVPYDQRSVDELVEQGIDDVVPQRPFSGETRVNVNNVTMFSQKFNTIPTADEVPVAADMLFEQASKLDGQLIEGMLDRIQKTVLTEDLPVVKETVAAARQIADKELVRLQNAMNKADLADDTFALSLELNDAYKARDALNEVDSALGSQSGRDLQNRQKYGSPVDDLSDAAQVERAADKAFQDSVKKVTKEKQPAIDKALNDGDNATAVKLMRERDEAISAEYQRFFKDEPKELDSTTFTGKFLEAQIGGVFSPTTVQYNVLWPAVKTALYPALRVVTDPFSRASWVRGAKTYGAMRGALNASVQAAKASWKYEQTLSTRDVNRVLEGGVQIKGKLGEFVRLFPRALASTDAFISEQAAAGFIVGEAAEAAVEGGLKKGLNGKALKEHVEQSIEKGMKDAYDRSVTEATIQPIVEKGKALNLTGADLEDYILKALNETDQGALKRLKDKDTKAYIDDLLYKRDFGSDGMDRGVVGEKVAKGVTAYEEFASRNKLFKIAGQLFIRTPIRVMEEGFRMTPMLNTLMPNFKRDLAGRNGRQRQARAQAEIMVGYSVVTYAMQAWAKGDLNGAGSSDYKREKVMADSDGLGQTSIAMGDGEKDISRLDPLRVPMTLVADAMDAVMLMDDREAQGAEGTNKLLQASGAAIASVVALFRDASLFGGATEAAEFVEKMMDAITDDNKGIAEAGKVLGDFILDKTLMTVPATAKKASKFVEGNDVLPNAYTMQQKILATIAPSSNYVPKQYDVHGNMRTVDDPMQSFWVFSYTSKEEKQKGKSYKELYVNRALNEMMRETDSTIGVYSDKDPRFLDDRLTEIYTEVDGVQITVYDAMMIEIKKQRITDVLYAILKTKAPMGNFQFDGIKTQKVKEAISKARTNALDIVIGNDPALKAREAKYVRIKAQTGAGYFDLNR